MQLGSALMFLLKSEGGPDDARREGRLGTISALRTASDSQNSSTTDCSRRVGTPTLSVMTSTARRRWRCGFAADLRAASETEATPAAWRTKKTRNRPTAQL